MNDLLKTDNGKDFMNFVNSRQGKMMKSQSIDGLGVPKILSPHASEYHRKSHVNVAGPSSPIMDRSTGFREHRLSNEYERSKTT